MNKTVRWSKGLAALILAVSLVYAYILNPMIPSYVDMADAIFIGFPVLMGFLGGYVIFAFKFAWEQAEKVENPALVKRTAIWMLDLPCTVFLFYVIGLALAFFVKAFPDNATVQFLFLSSVISGLLVPLAIFVFLLRVLTEHYNLPR